MFRGTTVRTVLAALTAVLLALPLFASTASFAQAHTARHAEAKARPGTALPLTALRDESVGSQDCGHPRGPADPLRPRDRHRTADSAPQAPERPLSAPDPAAPRSATPRRAPLGSPRPAPAPSPAALQVFRC
ncbi:hypothetical protein C3489_25885 [Streptomyces sp. Ru71]|uniref:hypothetical protein n=1 Tax=Streptomyces sp. Ru71 TaxID=2080746 RepID=UPI000CDDE8F2|nr:hypothetical protein [Streptomyces sp. Ru71]POX49003.1 hypothetical protein C3489_25885 [Streptomyces sp. Ru71]